MPGKRSQSIAFFSGEASQESWPKREEPARQAESVHLKRCAIFLMHAFAADTVYALKKSTTEFN